MTNEIKPQRCEASIEEHIIDLGGLLGGAVVCNTFYEAAMEYLEVIRKELGFEVYVPTGEPVNRAVEIAKQRIQAKAFQVPDNGRTH